MLLRLARAGAQRMHICLSGLPINQLLNAHFFLLAQLPLMFRLVAHVAGLHVCRAPRRARRKNRCPRQRGVYAAVERVCRWLEFAQILIEAKCNCRAMWSCAQRYQEIRMKKNENALFASSRLFCKCASILFSAVLNVSRQTHCSAVL